MTVLTRSCKGIREASPSRNWREIAWLDKDIGRQYFRALFRLYGELVKLQDLITTCGHKVVILFEDRDAAGRGGVIKQNTQRLNPRVQSVAALPAINDSERTQWYFQRYASHLHAAGGRALFDRN